MRNWYISNVICNVPARKALLEQQQQQLDDTTAILQTQMQYMLSLQQERLRGLALRLHSLSPLLTIVVAMPLCAVNVMRPL